MKCQRCGADNQGAARFCQGCGLPLSPAPALLPAGTVLQGRYQVEGVLGHGGMGAVYAARHLTLGEPLAVKEMREDLLGPAERPQAVAQFQHEARLLVRLQHPNLPRVWDHFTEGGRWYLVMDRVGGRTLAQAAAGGGPLPEAQVLGWAAQLCDVLDYLHRQSPPVVFRDLKPGNIMLDACGQVKLIDFGIVRLFDPAKGTDTLKMGTVGYAPPEQYAGQGQTTPRSDLYALGATLHQLLTGADPSARPFVFSPPRALNPGVSARVSDAVMKALSLAPADRFASAGEMKQALLKAARRSPAGRRGAPLALLWGVVAIMILALGAIVLAYSGVLSEPTPTAAPPLALAAASPAAVPSTGESSFAPTGTPLPPTSTALVPMGAPAATLQPGARPSSTPQPGGRRTATPTPPRSRTPAPELLKPDAGERMNGQWPFMWSGAAGPLAPGLAYDLVIWSEAEQREAARGVAPPTQATQITVDLDNVPAIRDYGPGTYYWAVIVVRVTPYQRVGEWGESRRFFYSFPPPPPQLPNPCLGFDCEANCCGAYSSPLCGQCCAGYMCP